MTPRAQVTLPAAVAATLCAVFVLTVWTHVMEIQSGQLAWKLADWLISYAGGPVRRGLTGQALLAVADLGVPLVWATVALQAGLCAVFLVLVGLLYLQQPRERTWLVFLLSPAFVMAWVHDPGGSMRKELIAYVAMAWAALAYSRGTLRQALPGVTGLFAVAVLAHEATALLVPLLAWMVWRGGVEGQLDRREAGGWAAALLAVAGAGLAFAVLHRGTPAHAAAVCAAVLARGLPAAACDGAIAWLPLSAADGTAAAGQHVERAPVYMHLAALALAPLLLAPAWLRTHGRAVAVAAVCTLPLYLVAIDWGRWINALVVPAFLLLLADRQVELRRLHPALIAAYVTTWGIAHAGGAWVGGWADVAVRYSYRAARLALRAL